VAKRLIGDAVWVVSGVGQGTGLLDVGGDRRRGKTVLWVNMGHPIVSNRDFVA